MSCPTHLIDKWSNVRVDCALERYLLPHVSVRLPPKASRQQSLKNLLQPTSRDLAMTRPGSKSALLRGSFTLLIVSSLVIIPSVPLMSWRAAATNALQHQNERMGNPKPGKPDATLPNLDLVRAEKPSVREVPIPIRSTVPSRKNPTVPWDGRRVGDPFTTNEPRAQARLRKRAHARPRARVSAPTFMSEDAFIDNFYN